MEVQDNRGRGPRAYEQVQLPYVIYDVSSVSGNFSCNHILEDKPSDQKSRWLSDGNKPPQYVVLKLLQPAIVQSIVFGKYEKSHPCNIQKFEVHGGLDADHTHLLLESHLKNDSIAETLDLQHEMAGMPFPSQYIRIVPLQSWGGSFNYSIWHIQLWGVADETLAEESISNLRQFKEREAVRLCLKYLRQNGYSEAFHALQKKSKTILEHPLLTTLYQHLVSDGNFELAETLVCNAVAEGRFDDYLSSQPVRGAWRLMQSVAHSTDGHCITRDPDVRGAHQMCMDPERAHIYLHGGWSGSKELSDFWRFDVKQNVWTCLSPDTSQVGGPGARSCHCMCYDAQQQALYLLGRYVDSLSMFELHHPQGDFYVYWLELEKWQLLSSDTYKDGGPHLIYDHQMQCDSDTGLLYVLGGRIVSTDMCSGLYVYHTTDRHWICLCPDQTSAASVQPFLPRSGHVMLLHPGLHQLFVMGGQRQQEFLSDLLRYDVKSGETTVLSSVPVDGMCLRAAANIAKHQICLFAGLSRSEERNGKRFSSLWLYSISLDKWWPVLKEDKVPILSSPVGRSAHSFVFDATNDTFYLFGGNPASDGNIKRNISMRLDDMWRLRLLTTTRESLLRECQLSLRKQRYLELSQKSPVEALTYLQTCIAVLVDHSNQEESQQYRQLTGILFGSGSQVQQSANTGKKRNELYNKLVSFFPDLMSQPKNSITDFV